MSVAFDRKAYMAKYNKSYYAENKEYWQENYVVNKDKKKKQAKQWAVANKDKKNQMSQKWRDENRDTFRLSCKKSTKKNIDKKLANNAKRRSLRIQRTVAWANEKEIQKHYAFAKFMEWITLGIKYHVDHIVPLQGKNVCGLHTHDNLQVIRATQNLKKGNKFDA
jgi:hypothetical protein